MIAIAALAWIAISALLGIVARTLAVKWAERNGYSALTMPMKYHVWFISIYLVIVQALWIVMYYWLIH